MNEYERKLLLDSIRNYQALCDAHGLSIEIPEYLKKLTIPELRLIERRLRELARTPTS